MFFPGTEALLHLLRSGRRFPAGWMLEPARVRPGETVHGWFRRIVDDLVHGDVGACQIDERLALFCILKPDGRRQVDFANIQALVTLDATLEDFYLDGTKPAQYLRLDYDPSEIGPMFKEPLPHIHVVPSGAPRCFLGGFGDVGIVVEFLDFIYRNYFYETHWVPWARQVWDRYRRERGMEDRFDVIAAAYKRRGGQAVLTSTLRADVLRLKAACRAAQTVVLAEAQLGDDGKRSLLSYGPD